MPLYVDERLDIGAGPIFLALRRADPRRAHRRRAAPDRLGGRRAGSDRARLRGASGSAIIAVWPTVVGLVVGTIVLAVGMSLHVSRAAAARAAVGVRRRACVGRRDGVVVLRPEPGRRRVHLRRRRRAHRQPRRVRHRDRRRDRRARAAAGRRDRRPRPDASTDAATHDRSRRTDDRTSSVATTDAVVARHERLPAEARRHPVVPVRAVAPAAGGRDDGAHDRVARAPTAWDAHSRSASSASTSTVLLPTATLRRRIDALAREVARRRRLPRPDDPARGRRPAPRPRRRTSSSRTAPRSPATAGSACRAAARASGAARRGRRRRRRHAIRRREAVRAAGTPLRGVVIPPGVDVDRFRPVDDDARRADARPGSASIPTGRSCSGCRGSCPARASTSSSTRARRSPDVQLAIGGAGRDRDAARTPAPAAA